MFLELPLVNGTLFTRQFTWCVLEAIVSGVAYGRLRGIASEFQSIAILLGSLGFPINSRVMSLSDGGTLRCYVGDWRDVDYDRELYSHSEEARQLASTSFDMETVNLASDPDYEPIIKALHLQLRIEFDGNGIINSMEI